MRQTFRALIRALEVCRMSPPSVLVGFGDGASHLVAGGSYFLTFQVFHNFDCSANRF